VATVLLVPVAQLVDKWNDALGCHPLNAFPVASLWFVNLHDCDVT